MFFKTFKIDCYSNSMLLETSINNSRREKEIIEIIRKLVNDISYYFYQSLTLSIAIILTNNM